MGICVCINDCIGEQPQSLSDLSSMKASISECYASSKETVELCTSTLATGKSLVSCGEEIQNSLVGAASEISAESFAVIADLIDGDKSREAKDLAVTMKDKSTECISLSIKMIKSLEASVDALPDVIENYIEKKAEQSITDGVLTAEERSMAAGIEDDAEELTACIDAIENLKLLTAVEAGTRSFNAIKEKSSLCQKIFETIKKFAIDVTEITSAISNMNASAVLSKIKDGSIYRAIGLSKYIQKFAEGCKKVMDTIIELFTSASGKLSTLWKSLSHAKEIMVNSLTDVVNARSLCDEANEKADKLKELTQSYGNIDVMKLIKSLSGEKSRSMNDAVGTARGIDDGMEAAALKMKNAARTVREEYHNLPSIVTGDITDDTEDEVTEMFSAKIRDIDGDVQELETATRSIEEADIISAAKSIHREIENVPGKVDTCKEMIESCTEFADRSKSSIDSFLGQWSLETAIEHIKEMCRLVSLGKLMEQLADKVHKLIKAITTLLRVMSNKVQKVADSLQNSGLDSVANAAADAAADLVSDGLNSMMGKVFGK